VTPERRASRVARVVRNQQVVFARERQRAESGELGGAAVATEREIDDAIGDADPAREAAATLVGKLDQAVAEQSSIAGEVIGKPIACGRVEQLIEQLDRAGAVTAGERTNLGRHREAEQQVQAAKLFGLEPERFAQPVEWQRHARDARQLQAAFDLLGTVGDLELQLGLASRFNAPVPLEHAARVPDDVIEVIANRAVSAWHIKDTTVSCR